MAYRTERLRGAGDGAAEGWWDGEVIRGLYAKGFLHTLIALAIGFVVLVAVS